MTRTNKCYITAESVIGVRNPNYDEDNISRETYEFWERFHGRTPKTKSESPSESLDVYENASRLMIQKVLAEI